MLPSATLAEPIDYEEVVPKARALPWYITYFKPLALPYWLLHALAVVGPIITIAQDGWRWGNLAMTALVYAVAMFFVTGGYHRYFAHRTYKASRAVQLVLALGAQATLQKGALWWAAHHRHHHKASDTKGDLHSVRQSGFWWAHMGWILSTDFDETDLSKVKDLATFPELVWLNKYWVLPGLAYAAATFWLGGFNGLVWAWAVPIVLNWHGTFTINSLSHVFGRQRYATGDDSRNNLLLAIITHGEGWHNNHHHYQVSTRQGFRWWEIDVTYYALRVLSLTRLVHHLHPVPAHIVRGERKPGR
ncbi:MAG: acyl-CoA desaturase [Myxococcales bacterium]|nr:acyl-CoA desaturase [Myxococcales bacterium]